MSNSFGIAGGFAKGSPNSVLLSLDVLTILSKT
jgi:hypothetical protein